MGGGSGNQEHCFGCAGFEMPIRYSNEDAMLATGYMNLDIKEGVRARVIILRLISI